MFMNKIAKYQSNNDNNNNNNNNKNYITLQLYFVPD